MKILIKLLIVSVLGVVLWTLYSREDAKLKLITDFDNVTVIRSNDDLEKLISQENDDKILYMARKSCRACELMRPVMSMVIDKNKNTTFYYIDLDEVEIEEELAIITKLKSTPHLVSIKGAQYNSSFLFEGRTKEHDINLWLKRQQ